MKLVLEGIAAPCHVIESYGCGEFATLDHGDAGMITTINQPHSKINSEPKQFCFVLGGIQLSGSTSSRYQSVVRISDSKGCSLTATSSSNASRRARIPTPSRQVTSVKASRSQSEPMIQRKRLSGQWRNTRYAAYRSLTDTNSSASHRGPGRRGSSTAKRRRGTGSGGGKSRRNRATGQDHPTQVRSTSRYST